MPLNATGIAQAEALARRLAGWPIGTIYSSDLQRARQTAEVLGTAVHLTPIIAPIWRERHVGIFEGLTRADIEANFPELHAELRRGLLNPPQGEHIMDLHARSVKAFEAVIDQHQGETVAIVSHGGTLHAVITYVLGLPPHQINRFTLRGNTGLSIVEVDGRGPVLTLLNDTYHLDTPTSVS